MDAVFYSLAFAGSQTAPVQLARSLNSLRIVSPDQPVFVFLFGESPRGFVEALRQLNADVRPLGDYRAYIARVEPDHAELFALDPRLHRWLVLEEPELKACARLLYIDSDTFFFEPASNLFERYRDADLYAREEPLCRRSIHGYNPSYLDEEKISELRVRERLGPVPPFNTGVCLFTRELADAITANLPHYFDYLYRFLSWFQLHPVPVAGAVTSSTQMIYERHLRSAAGQALPYPSQNRWIVDEIALWLALGRFSNLRFADFAPSDVWQGAEFEQMSTESPLPQLCHYYGKNTDRFFDLLYELFPRGLKRQL
jgi:hypothetical protein